MTFDEIRQMFLDSRVALGCMPRTIVWYRHMITRYGGWLAENNRTVATAKLTDLQQYLAHLRTTHQPGSVRQNATALKTFYRWALQAELITVNPATDLKRPRVPDVIPPVAARSYVQHMLSNIKLWTWVDHRDKLIIQILFCTGLRISECANLQTQNIDFEKRRLAIVGKGGKLRYQPFPDQLVEPLHTWLDRWRPPIPDVPWLFFSATSRGAVRGPLTKQAIYDTMKRHAEAASLDWIPPHGYRRGFAIDMLEHGASTRLVQALLGHASVVTTEKYLRLSPDQTHVMFDDLWSDLEQVPEEVTHLPWVKEQAKGRMKKEAKKIEPQKIEPADQRPDTLVLYDDSR